MDLRSISGNQITIWAALAVGLAVALVMGSAVGSADMRFVAGVVAVIPAVVIFVKLKTNIWVLLPIGWYLIGRLPWLPVPFTVRDLCFLTVIGFFTIFAATRVVSLKRNLTTLDYLIYINLAYLVTVFVRNPVGVLAMQSSIVGGRPYFEIILAFGAYLILSRVQISDFIAKVFPLFIVIPTWSVGALDLFARLNPQTGYVLNSIYNAVGTGGIAAGAQSEGEIGVTRMVAMKDAGASTALALCAKYNPITLISPLHPFRVIALAVAFGAIFLSGYRSLLLFGFIAFVLSAILRRQVKDVWVAMSGGLLALIMIIALQGNVLQLPLTMQRALSWLPGDWDPVAVMDAEDSTLWRVEMWGWAWNDERILRDRVWGQGFGFNLDDMNLIMASMAGGYDGSSLLGGSDRERFMITGSFHSGPLSSIKFIGVVGLILFFTLLCYMAALAWRLCARARGTEAFTLALFVGIPIIYEPFNFVFIFGALDSGYPQQVYWAGLLNMVQRYLDQGNHVTPTREVESIQRRLSAIGRAQPQLARQYPMPFDQRQRVTIE